MREQKNYRAEDFEQRLLIRYINTVRSVYLDVGKPIEDVNDLLIKATKTKIRKSRI